MQLEPGALTDYDLRLFDNSSNLLGQSIKEQFMSQSPLNVYQMFVDFF